MSTFALVDADGVVHNLIELEEGADWSPPDGFKVIPEKDAKIPPAITAKDAFAITDIAEVPFLEDDYIELRQAQALSSMLRAFPKARMNDMDVLLTCDAGEFLFKNRGGGSYGRIMTVKDGMRGQGYGEKMLRSALRWMFTKTDALHIRGLINESNIGSIKTSEKGCGAIMIRRPMAKKVAAHYTIASWAQAYGMKRALQEMRVNGQGEKADLLQQYHETAEGAKTLGGNK